MAIAAHVAAAADPRHLSPSSHSGMLAAVTAAARLSVAALAARPLAAIAPAETLRVWELSACASTKDAAAAVTNQINNRLDDGAV